MSPQTLSVCLLGEFRISQDETPLTAALTPRLQAVLAYLLLHGDAIPSRQQLAFTLWPDSGDAQARTNLRKTFHRLRHACPVLDVYLDFDGATITRRPRAQIWTDVAHFEAQLQRAESAPLHQQPELLQAALELYKGPLLPDLYDDWLLPYRERLRQRYLEALDHLAQLLEARRNYLQAGQALRRVLDEEPVQERAYRRLMRLQALSGDVAGALRTYHQCAALLLHELGVEPDPATQNAYHQLLKREAIPPATSRPMARRIPLVGRDDAWQRLQAAWRAAANGAAQAVLITGEAGIGKTRLAEEFYTWAKRQGITALRAACYATEDQLPFAPVAGWLRCPPLQQALAALEPRWRSEVARVLPELLAADSRLQMPPPLTESWQKQHLFMALAAAITAAGYPLLLLLDDLHWADANTLSWLHFLLRQNATNPILFLATVRSEELVPDHRLQTWQRELASSISVHHIPLTALDAPATTALASHVLGADLNASAAVALFQATEGNPLFTVEMLRAGAEPDTKRLPQKIRSVVELRLERLSTPARDLLGLAAIIGRSFTHPLLAAASQLPDTSLVLGLDELWQRQIIREHGDDGYDFSHDIIRQVTLSLLSVPRQRWAHQQVAAALQQLSGTDLKAAQGQIAVHLAAAGHKQKAAHHFVNAATNASSLYAHQEAIRHLQRALAMLPPADRRRAAIHGARGEAFLLLGKIEESAAAFLEAAAATTDPLAAARWHARRVRALSIPGSLHLATPSFDDATLILDEIPVAQRDATFWSVWIDLHLHYLRALYFNNLSQEMDLISQSLAQPLKTYGTARQRANYYAALEWARSRRLRYKLGVQDPSLKFAALEAAKETADENFIASHRFGYGFTLLWARELPRAHAQLEQALGQATTVGNIPLQCMCLAYLSVIYRFWKDEKRLRETVAMLLPLAENTAESNYSGVCHAQRAWLAWRGADKDAATSLAEVALAQWRPAKSPYPLYWLALFPLLAIALEEDQDLPAATEHARALLAPPQQLLPDLLNDSLEAAVAAAEPYLAAPYLQEACRLARQHGYL